MSAVETIKRNMPKSVFYGLKKAVTRSKTKAAHAAFREAGDTPSYLTYADLEALQRRYPHPPVVGYSVDETLSRGKEKFNVISKLTQVERPRSLEVGCWDGMTSGLLASSGWDAHAIDIRDIGFDRRAIEAGAKLRAMDASQLDFPDNHFDIVYSYDSFEHFHDPAAVLSEIIRVTKPGGRIYVFFGPLYNSPFGLHAYLSVTVPFCQILFRSEDMDKFTSNHGYGTIDYAQLNNWSLSQFRALWASQADRLVPRWYYEGYTSRGVELIAAHPSCFRAKQSDFDEFLVSAMEALFVVTKKD